MPSKRKQPPNKEKKIEKGKEKPKKENRRRRFLLFCASKSKSKANQQPRLAMQEVRRHALHRSRSLQCFASHLKIHSHLLSRLNRTLPPLRLDHHRHHATKAQPSAPDSDNVRETSQHHHPNHQHAHPYLPTTKA
jgi:hypothetical protein